MVARRVCAVLTLACVMCSSAVTRAGVDGGPSTHRKIVLLRKKWDWKTASDEVLTEWAIELRRYNMVDMELNDMVVRLSLILPVDPTTGETNPRAEQSEVESEVEHMKEKAAKVERQLDAAAHDQHVANDTFGDMATERHQLSAGEKQALFDQHAEEVKKSQDLSSSGHEALRRALAVLTLFDQAALSLPARPTGTNVTHAAGANATLAINGNTTVAINGNATVAINGSSLADMFNGVAAARAAVSPTVQTYNHFKEAADAFHAKRGEFAQEARKTKSKLLAIKSKISKVELHDD